MGLLFLPVARSFPLYPSPRSRSQRAGLKTLTSSHTGLNHPTTGRRLSATAGGKSCRARERAGSRYWGRYLGLVVGVV